jgi:drug/metabolite transporter (DMT)-like permease
LGAHRNPPANVCPVTGRRLLLTATRIGLPLALAVAGIVAIVVEHGKDNATSAAGVALIIAAVIVWMINWMFRMSVSSNEERRREEEARDYFGEHGRWPDE